MYGDRQFLAIEDQGWNEYGKVNGSVLTEQSPGYSHSAKAYMLERRDVHTVGDLFKQRKDGIKSGRASHAQSNSK